jgi:hypothetical protein
MFAQTSAGTRVMGLRCVPSGVLMMVLRLCPFFLGVSTAGGKKCELLVDGR